jgi:hypothetical protein
MSDGNRIDNRSNNLSTLLEQERKIMASRTMHDDDAGSGGRKSKWVSD